MRAVVFVAAVILFVVSTTALQWDPIAIDLKFTIPSSDTVRTVAFLSADDNEDGRSWQFVSDSIQNCNIPGLTISPMEGTLDSNFPTEVTFTIDPSGYHQVLEIDDCELFVEFDDLNRAMLMVNVLASSNWCTYHYSNYCNYGTCNNITHSCDCSENYYGPICITYCLANTTCYNHGSCSDEGICSCASEWYGANCNIYCDPKTNCSSNGSCSLLGTCSCNPGYFGNDCSVFCNDTVMCSGHGQCSYNGSTLGCTCDNTHWGPHCENECKCSINGHCNNAGHCACDQQYFGETCDTKCTQDENCNGNGYCGDDGLSCICFNEYFGSACTMNKLIVGMSVGLSGLLVIIVTVFLVRHYRRRNGRYQQIQ